MSDTEAPKVRPKTVGAQEASAYTGIPYRTLIDLARAGHLPYVKLPGVRRWRFRLVDLDAALEKWTHRAKPEPSIAGLDVYRELELIEGKRRPWDELKRR